jgi:hypothetical protein
MNEDGNLPHCDLYKERYTFQKLGNVFPYHSTTVILAAPVVPHVLIRYLPRFNNELNSDPACNVRVENDSTITRVPAQAVNGLLRVL